MSKKDNVVEISDFFVTSNEKNGVWYEAKTESGPCGIEFYIYGQSSDRNIISADVYKKEKQEAEDITDPVKYSDKIREITCKRIAAVIGDIRGANGKKLVSNGEEIKYSEELILKILEENIDIRTDLLQAIFTSENFQKKKN